MLKKLEAVLAFLSIFRLLIFLHKIFLTKSKVFSFFAFFDGTSNLESLKYWANDEHGFMTGLSYITKILLKTEQRVSLHKTSKRV